MRNLKTITLIERLLPVAAMAATLLLACAAQASAPGITGGSSGAANFDLTAEAAYTSQPDGASIYSWGYGCNTAPAGFLPTAISGANCPRMQIPGPTMIVTEGDVVTVTLHNNLPPAAGNTSMLFPGFEVTAVAASGQLDPSCATAQPGLLTTEAAHGCVVTYSFKATTPGTHSYYSGTQGDLQVEMGLHGAFIVLPNAVPSACTTGLAAQNLTAETTTGESDFRLAKAAYDHPATCYDREYLFQFSEMDPQIHTDVEQIATCTGNNCPANMNSVQTEPYHAAYFLVNGRSYPDDADPNYTVQYPHQPYNGNPHMHPGELVLVRIVGSGRMQHPFHEHGNHVRVLARDGNLLLAPNAVNGEAEKRLAGPLLFTTTTTPGLAMDGIYQWTGKGLNWDVFGHYNNLVYSTDSHDPLYNVKVECVPDANGYFTGQTSQGRPATTLPNYYEWCGDHNKPLEAKPFGAVGSNGPVTLPDPNVLTNGAYYGGSPYLGPEAMARAVGSTPIPPSGTVGNSPTSEAGFAYMWHSHNEREITTDNIFPGGMMMMMLVDPRAFAIDESK